MEIKDWPFFTHDIRIFGISPNEGDGWHVTRNGVNAFVTAVTERGGWQLEFNSEAERNKAYELDD